MKGMSFFPSRTFALYASRLFLTRTFAILFALVLVLPGILLCESHSSRDRVAALLALRSRRRLVQHLTSCARVLLVPALPTP